MPGFDGTGPLGLGPMTGGGRGWCNPYSPLRAGAWLPFGVGRGWGYGLGWLPYAAVRQPLVGGLSYAAYGAAPYAPPLGYRPVYPVAPGPLAYGVPAYPFGLGLGWGRGRGLGPGPGRGFGGMGRGGGFSRGRGAGRWGYW